MITQLEIKLKYQSEEKLNYNIIIGYAWDFDGTY